jgi:hypothetical protein
MVGIILLQKLYLEVRIGELYFADILLLDHVSEYFWIQLIQLSLGPIFASLTCSSLLPLGGVTVAVIFAIDSGQNLITLIKGVNH